MVQAADTGHGGDRGADAAHRRCAALTIMLRMPAVGWDGEGHMSVAYITYQQLTPATRARVKALLALNPYASDPNEWPKLLAKGPAGEDVDEMTFMIAATWPDQIKVQSGRSASGSNRNRAFHAISLRFSVGDWLAQLVASRRQL